MYGRIDDLARGGAETGGAVSAGGFGAKSWGAISGVDMGTGMASA